MLEPRPSSTINIRIAHEAIKHWQMTGNDETEATIWRNLRSEAIRPVIQQFLFKTTHNTYMVGEYWRRIRGCEDRGTCTTCDTTESMNHILTECNAPPDTPNLETRPKPMAIWQHQMARD